MAVESSLRPLIGACLEIATGVTDGPRSFGHTAPMDKQTEFVSKRLAAHVAACADVMADPLVKIALADRAAAIDVLARLKAYRETPPAPVATIESVEYVYPGYGPRRQAE